METAGKAKAKERAALRWQRDLLPFMTRTIVILSAFFFIASCAQLVYLQISILNGPKFDTSSSLSQLLLVQSASQDDILRVSKIRTLVLLGSSSIGVKLHGTSVSSGECLTDVTDLDHVYRICDRDDPRRRIQAEISERSIPRSGSAAKASARSVQFAL